MRTGALPRVALLAALLTGLSVLLTVGPVLFFVGHTHKEQAREDVAALVHASLNTQDLEPSLGLDGWTGVSEDRLPAFADPVAERLALRCEMPEAPGPLAAVGPLRVDGQLWVGACGLSPKGTPMLGWRAVPDLPLRLRSAALLALATGLASGLALTLVLGRDLAPLSEMARFAEVLGQGARPEPLPPPSDPQLRSMQQALNRLSSALADREDEIAARQALTEELGAIVAHEVRNPLQSAMMLTDLLAHEPDASERAATLTEVHAELDLIEAVVQRLLTSKGKLRLVHTPFDLRAQLQRVADLQGPRAARAGLELTLALPAGAVQVHGDAPLLRRCVENLLDNAFAVLAETGGSTVHLGLRCEDGGVRVVVEDDGPGVPLPLREDIFRSGVSHRSGGSGLGLALALQVVEAHGGALTVDDSPLGGARFLMTLPGAAS